MGDTGLYPVSIPSVFISNSDGSNLKQLLTLDDGTFGTCSTVVPELPPANPVITINSGYSSMCSPYSLILDAGAGYKDICGQQVPPHKQ